MKRYTIGIVALLVLCGALAAQSVKLPAEVKGEVGAFVRVAAETDGKEVRWLCLDSGLSVFPADLLKDSKTTVVVAQKPGKYRLAAWTAKGDVPSEAAIVTVIIGDPGPDPGPGPGPQPDDPLTKLFAAAYGRETDSDKAELRKALVAIYREAAEVANAKEVETWGSLFTVVGKIHDKLGTRGKMPAIQGVTQTYLQERFPSESTKKLTVDDRVLASQTFKKLASALEGVK